MAQGSGEQWNKPYSGRHYSNIAKNNYRLPIDLKANVPETESIVVNCPRCMTIGRKTELNVNVFVNSSAGSFSSLSGYNITISCPACKTESKFVIAQEYAEVNQGRLSERFIVQYFKSYVAEQFKVGDGKAISLPGISLNLVFDIRKAKVKKRLKSDAAKKAFE